MRRVKPSAYRQIRGAALNVTVEEPLPAASPLWTMDHELITLHTAGATCRYEDEVLAIAQENISRLWQGENELLKQVVQIHGRSPLPFDPQRVSANVRRRPAKSAIWRIMR